MILKGKSRTTKKKQGQGISSYLTRFQNVCDELVVVGENPDGKELVLDVVNGFSQE